MKDNTRRDMCILTRIIFPVLLIFNVDTFYKMEFVNPMVTYIIGNYLITLMMSSLIVSIFYITKYLISLIKP